MGLGGAPRKIRMISVAIRFMEDSYSTTVNPLPLLSTTTMSQPTYELALALRTATSDKEKYKLLATFGAGPLRSISMHEIKSSGIVDTILSLVVPRNNDHEVRYICPFCA